MELPGVEVTCPVTHRLAAAWFLNLILRAAKRYCMHFHSEQTGRCHPED